MNLSMKWCRTFHLHVLSFGLDENLKRSNFFGGGLDIYMCVCVFIKFHNFSMSRMNISVGIWQSESFIEKYLPSDVSPLENEHSHLKI